MSTRDLIAHSLAESHGYGSAAGADTLVARREIGQPAFENETGVRTRPPQLEGRAAHMSR
jgi:hypothetical protein